MIKSPIMHGNLGTSFSYLTLVTVEMHSTRGIRSLPYRPIDKDGSDQWCTLEIATVFAMVVSPRSRCRTRCFYGTS